MGRGPQGLVSGLGFSPIHTYVAARVLHAWYMAGVSVCFVLLLIHGLGLLAVDRFPWKETHSFSEDMATAGFLYSSECLTPTHLRAL